MYTEDDVSTYRQRALLRSLLREVPFSWTKVNDDWCLQITLPDVLTGLYDPTELIGRVVLVHSRKGTRRIPLGDLVYSGTLHTNARYVPEFGHTVPEGPAYAITYVFQIGSRRR